MDAIERQELSRLIDDRITEAFERSGFRSTPGERLSSESRYRRDPIFRHMVDILHSMLESSANEGRCWTPTEMREASMLAINKYEAIHIRPMFLSVQNPER